jgi:hypothetical protein
VLRDLIAAALLLAVLFVLLGGDAYRFTVTSTCDLALSAPPSATASLAAAQLAVVIAPSARRSVALWNASEDRVQLERATESVRVVSSSDAGARRVLRTAVSAELVVSVTGDLTLQAFRRHSLQLEWESHVSLHVHPSYRLDRDDVALALFPNHSLQLGDSAGCVVVAGRLVAFSGLPLGIAEDAYLSVYAFDAITGALRWKHEAIEPQIGDDAAGDDAADVVASLKNASKPIQITAGNVDRVARLIHGIDEPRGAAHREAGEQSARMFGRQLTQLMDELGAWRSATDTRLRTAWLSAKPHAALHASNGSGPHGYRNVLLARHRDGLEALHLFSGRVVFRLPMESGRVFVDVNADGRLDSAELVYVRRHEVMDIKTLSTAIGASDDPIAARRARFGSFGDEVVPALRVWSDVPASHLLFDVPLVGAQMHSGLFEALTVAQRAASTVNREMADIFHDGLFNAADQVAHLLGWRNAPARASNESDWDGAGRDAVPCVLRRARAAPLVVAMTRTGSLFAVEVRSGLHTHTLWRRHSPVLAHNSDASGDAPQLAQSGGQLLAISLGGEPAVLASGALGAVVYDANGRELAAVLWPEAARHGVGELYLVPNEDSTTTTTVRFIRYSHNRFSIYEIEHRPAAALRPLLVLLVAVALAVLLVAVLAADVPSMAAHLNELRRRQRRAQTAARADVAENDDADSSASDRSTNGNSNRRAGFSSKDL